MWESTFVDGMIDEATVLDAQVNYGIPKLKSTLKIGAANLGGKDTRTSIRCRCYWATIFCFLDYYTLILLNKIYKNTIMIKNIKWLLLVAATLVACNNDDETVVVLNSSDGLPLTSGTADFSKYVALGNSLTAGFSDGALFVDGQKGSYTNILAQQFAQVGGGEFKIPYMSDNIGGLLFGGAPNPSFVGLFIVF